MSTLNTSEVFEALIAEAKSITSAETTVTLKLANGQIVEIKEENGSISGLVPSSQIAPENVFKPAPVQCQPPLIAVFLPYLLLPKKNRETILADLEEEYKEVYARFGSRMASVWFWKQVLWSLCPLWNGWLAKYGAKLGEWSKGVVAEAIKRRMG